MLKARILYSSALLRRTVTVPLLLAFSGLALAVLPVALLGDAITPRRRGRRRRRVSRLGLFLAVYLYAEIAGLLWSSWVWIRCAGARRAGSEAYVDANLRILEALLARLTAAAARLFGLRPGEVSATDLGGDAIPSSGPVLVFSRHAGPGDSLLLVYALLAFAGRRPRIVLKSALSFDPLADVLIGRMPHHYVRPHGADDQEAGAEDARCIGELAAGMGPRDALVLFPEGGNFTPGRRQQVIRSLRRRRMPRAAARARRLRHVLPPRPAGLFASVDAAPEGAAVLFVAHTGLDHIESAGDAWRALPLTRPVQAAWWRIAPADIPAADRPEQERLAWLQEQWVRVDQWIDVHREQGDGASVQVQAPASAPAPAPAPASIPALEPDGPVSVADPELSAELVTLTDPVPLRDPVALDGTVPRDEAIVSGD